MLDAGRTPEALSTRFSQFAGEAGHYSPLYSALAGAISGDAELLALISRCRPDQPAPNMLFGAVHFLQLKGNRHPLAAHYPTLTPKSLPADGAFPHFRSFCLQNRNAIMELMQTQRVQTNEVGRSTFLYPAFCFISQQVGGTPLALVDIGPSAGLTMNWDRYSYVYRSSLRRGSADAALQLECDLRGSQQPRLPQDFPQIHSRVGLELHPINLDHEDERLWLEALIWPEHLERVRLLHAALEIWRAHPQSILAGDAVDILPSVLQEIPGEVPTVVYHSMALYQFPAERQARFKELLQEFGRKRPIYHLSAEWVGGMHTEVRLSRYSGNQTDEWHLANAHSHGLWLEWLAAEAAD